MATGSQTGSQTAPHYSFPVVTGIAAGDPASTREARMKIFERFTAELDSTGQKISEKLSEVDLSNPEDVKALIPDHATEVLVHFGDDHFLDRYRKFEKLLPQWHNQYPNLASVDMRYEREVVLDMAHPASGKPEAPLTEAKLPAAKADAPAKTATAPAHALLDHPRSAVHPVAAKAPAKVVAHPPVVHAPAKSVAASQPPPHAAPPVVTASAPKPVLAPATPPAAVPSASAAARSGFPANHPASVPVTHPATTPPTHAVASPPSHLPAHSGKPSAGKPMVPSSAAHSSQGATP